MDLTQKKAKIKDRVQELLDKGNELYGTDAVLSEIKFSDNLTTTYGKAQYSKIKGFVIILSSSEIDKNFSMMIDEVAPHEVAHIICYDLSFKDMASEYGHGDKWKEVCLALGGNGQRLLDPEKLKHHYKTKSGRSVYVSPAVHDDLQNKFHVYNYDGERFSASHYVGKA